MSYRLIFSPFPFRNTNRLSLRELNESDLQDMYMLRSDDKVNKYINRKKPKSVNEVKDFILDIQEGIMNGKWIYWVISQKNNPKLIGTICLWNFSIDNLIAEIGFELLPTYHGKGLMSEAVNNVIDYASNNLKLKQIEAFTHKENRASCNLLEHHNFRIDKDKIDLHNRENVMYFLAL